MIVYPPKKQLTWMLLALAGIAGFLAYALTRQGYFTQATPLTHHLPALAGLLLAGVIVKQMLRIISGGPSLVVDEKGLFFYTSISYGKTRLAWEEIQAVEPLKHRSARGITFHAIKIVPKDYDAFVRTFRQPRRMVIRMANLGAGKALEIPQIMLDQEIKTIVAAMPLCVKR